jgi:hypothetical protein
MKESEIEMVHFYHGPGQGSSYRLIHLPTGLSVEFPTRGKTRHNLYQYLFKQLQEKLARTCWPRDKDGNPFRPVALDPSWLTPTVKSLAKAIYEDRTFSDLPLLADALEEAGCTSETILCHLRGPGPHVLGCWALDLLLGKS